ncbi:MAG: hypothetical protein J6W09_02230 [Bacteroidales bacterium]|nr:hypothetical protein [Bacteroidales bacterium]
MALAGTGVSAQTGEYMAYTPYSIFGIGDLYQQGSAYHRSMAGVGIASRDVRYLNSLNPASLPVRDTLSFMLDFSLLNSNNIYRQGDIRSARNITNMGSITMSFPIMKNLAMMVGVSPYSAGGYGYSVKETDPAVIATTGNINYYDYGQGSLYKLYGGLGYAILKNLSVGAEADYIFGNSGKYFTEQFLEKGYNTVQDSYTLNLQSFTGKFGVQYEQNLSTKTKLGIGATYTLGSELKGTVDYKHQSVGSAETVTVSSKTDTLGVNSESVRLASEFGVGISLNIEDRLRAELDYSYADWTGTGMGTASGFANPECKTPFAAGVRQCFRAGVEYTPDRFNVRYRWKRYSYRAGAYYTTEYYKVAGNEIGTFGITFGATLPVRETYLHNGISLGVDMGQRGTTKAGLVRERYIRFCVGLNLHDIWFQKRRYE